MKFNLVVFPNIEYQQNLWKIYAKVHLWIKKKKKAYYSNVVENRNGGKAFSEALHIEFLLDLKRLMGCMGEKNPLIVVCERGFIIN